MNRVRGEVFNGFKLIELLRQHVPSDFDPDDFVIAGSGRLWAGGITPRLSDLDILVRPGSETWRRAMEIAFDHALIFDAAPLRSSAFTGDKIARLYGGVVEVCQTWLLPGSDTEALLEQADLIDGLKYLPLAEVISYKRWLNREKDRADLEAIHAYYRSHRSTSLIDAVLCHAVHQRWIANGGRHGFATASGHRSRP